MARQLLNLIGNHFQPAESGKTLDVWDPAQGRVYALLPRSDADDIETAVLAAETAFADWSGLAPDDRAKYLFQVADQIEARLEDFAQAESLDTGKPLWLARQVDIPRAVRNFRFFAAGLLHFSSESHALPGFLNYTLRQSLGVVACISPWNLPLYLLSWKIAPALAMGNTVVAKPSEVTPLTAVLLSEVLLESGFPKGVLNLVHGLGSEAGAALIHHPKIKAISFTGSTRTGAEIARIAAPRFKKLSLEMGGKNAALVFADCDYENMLETSVRSAFTNQGQICLCMSRILVERSLYSRFRDDFVARVKALKVGDPQEPDTRIGALVSQAHQEKILRHIDLAQQEGGSLLCGGQSVQLSGRCAQGWFVQPTVFEGLSASCRTNQEEIFGPVVTLQAFDNESEALALANGTDYGLASSVWTTDQARALRLSEKLQAGLVWVNCWMERDLRTPFGGVKNSGLGREGGWEALRFFSEAKNICLAYPP
ncbi:2-hydroxymuconic semialdehyde dehydrogenase [bacterium (Candidatus Blackallbacteria) CG17_big_fil_post_rev_8_21_14_2_50_48_46]|uniref:2-hydroxymuconic semialdehyde dehydrogenase n=1 Tax=bacterium (Candidatus Blackallbacteria) CG17_big_fil_post_rev_8_21_14_2_50_48_46 TaxID=2014261 RepID=A0A2M7G029_9BACT|nr:MAG: 2-hydroxymuconic semialdehyde dehydrogenase [bacterium (Candidatus Blackallbacteria) CG18_big_fil_WC_8_21_14_2_50_49_26]PIW14769.1 MAG: 2-hydroxymuconic semialdehyde dehydrogenase [bacterium (Candidatus Blackallbacteria) CG17_big_fil_post_rev_8_21_14_2_50_48_46]PIW50871.1 MAG: 2-hydroxymuconic semialdehyde dehydrogenase [bacterium (Candidatus Blackallbacteria) CG13_big_fil_rev_8_21_14_2_50_49_14]